MKIGYFVSKYPYSTYSPEYLCGGSILAAQYLIQSIRKKKYQINIFSTSKDNKEEIERNDNVCIYRYATNVNFLSANISIDQFIKPLQFNEDIIHTHFDIPPGPFAGYYYCKRKKTPLVLTYHGDWDSGFGSVFRKSAIELQNRFFVDKLLSLSKKIIVPSSTYVNKSLYLKKFQEKIIIIPNGVDLEQFTLPYSKEECRKMLNLPVDSKILLFMGYLTPYKNPDFLIKLMPNIKKKFPDSLLIIAGDGSMRKNLEQMTIDLDMENYVFFPGFVGNGIKQLYYKSSDLFCLFSTTDCSPLTILEAMASETPVICSDIGGIPDIVKNDINGILINPENFQDIENKIGDLLGDEKFRNKLAQNGKATVTKYSWNNIADQVNNIYLHIHEK